MNVTIIGLGLIGGSVGSRILETAWASEVVGVDDKPVNLHKAAELGLISDTSDFNDAIKVADLVVMAIPVDKIADLLPEVLDAIKPGAVVVDMGSTKGSICESVEHHANRSAFVASHPIAGTENSGPSAAFASLFDNKTGILCDVNKSTDHAVRLVKDLYRILGMRVIEMDSHAHDMHIAYVSHLSHISSFVLGQTVLEIEQDQKSIFDMAGSGFASTVRLAKSSPEMWASIFSENKEHISKSLDFYINNLLAFKSFIDENKKAELYDTMKRTNEIRRVLDGIDIKHSTPQKDQEKIGV